MAPTNSRKKYTKKPGGELICKNFGVNGNANKLDKLELWCLSAFGARLGPLELHAKRYQSNLIRVARLQNEVSTILFNWENLNGGSQTGA